MLGITICATSDAGPFWELVDEAAQFEQASSIRALGYHPHITLTRYQDLSQQLLLAAATALGDDRPVSLTFDRIGVFDTDPIVLWLAPRTHKPLLSMHDRVHETIDPALCDPYYRPGRWTPHLTLAMSIPTDRRASALAFATRPFEPFNLTFDTVECVSWPPVSVQRSLMLHG
ncbi:2'-5' RNA ligase [Hyphomicrobiales bacterium]|nr:2'-5' RNA ligase [Hyphomicrobiales bacterium]CAH1700328.1 2'-5' RNA ligase [Hyphomicrobiales bacterium]CAI0344209.1 2'-5' RNA ligase [Hyphomicrobiales bacterium]